MIMVGMLIVVERKIFESGKNDEEISISKDKIWLFSYKVVDLTIAPGNVVVQSLHAETRRDPEDPGIHRTHREL